MVIERYSVRPVYGNVWFWCALHTGVLQGFKEFSEALPQSPKSDEDRDREFQEQLWCANAEIDSVIGNDYWGCYWSGKNPAKCRILRGRLMFEIFSNTVENKHAEEIGTDYDVDRIRTHGVRLASSSLATCF